MKRAAAWALAALVAGCVAHPAAALVLIPHHYTAHPATGRESQAVLSSDLIDPASPGDAGALNLQLIGFVIASGTLDHAGYTNAAGVVTLTAPTRSRDLIVAGNAQVTVLGGWALTPAHAWRLYAGGAVTVQGTLDLGGASLTVETAPEPAFLPVPLVTATELAGALGSVSAPAGTVVNRIGNQLWLEASP